MCAYMYVCMCCTCLCVRVQVEPFAPVLTIVRLPSQGTPDFMRRAAAFANDTLWGSLSCTVVMPPSVEKEFADDAEKVREGRGAEGAGMKGRRGTPAWAGTQERQCLVDYAEPCRAMP